MLYIAVCRQHPFIDDCSLFYRFCDDEEGAAAAATVVNDAELTDAISLLVQLGPDATMRMILRKQ